MTLYDVVAAGDLDAVKAALQDVRDVNQQGELQRTPLIEAARQGRADLVALLLEAGAEPMLKDSEHESALLKAAANGHREVVGLLWPLADEEDQQLATAFLGAFGKSSGPEYQAPEPGRFAKKVDQLKRGAVVATARAAKFVGHDDPQDRLDRIARAEDLKRKK